MTKKLLHRRKHARAHGRQAPSRFNQHRFRPLQFENLEDRLLLAADAFDVVGPSLLSEYQLLQDQLTGHGATVMATTLSEVISSASQSGFVSPALVPSEPLEQAHTEVYENWVTDASTNVVTEESDSFWDRVWYQAKETFVPDVNKPSTWIKVGVGAGCVVGSLYTGGALAPFCGALSLTALEVEWMINRGELTVEHLRMTDASGDTIDQLEKTFDLLAAGKQLRDLAHLADSGYQLLKGNATIVDKLELIGGVADGVIEGGTLLLERMRPILQDGFRDKSTAGEDAFVATAANNIVSGQILHDLGMASWLANQDSPLSPSDKELLRSLQLNDPDILSFAELPTDVSNDLMAMLGATSSVFVSLSDSGALSVRGSDASDNIEIRRDFGTQEIRVQVSGVPVATFPGNQVAEIQVYAEGGNDFVAIRDDIMVGTYLAGGSGNDRLQGGEGPDILIGGPGNDELYGGLGDDVSIGGLGDDEIVSGNGLDVNYGGEGTDAVSDRDVDPAPLDYLADVIEFQKLTLSSTKVTEGATVRLDYTVVGAPIAPTKVMFYRDNGDRVWDSSDTIIDTDNTIVSGTAHGYVVGAAADASYYFARAEFPDQSLSEPVSTFIVGVASDEVPPAVNIVDVAPDPRTTSVATIAIEFSESVVGVEVSDFSLSRDGVQIPLAGVVHLSTSNNRTFVLANLSGLTDMDGQYTLTLNASGSGISDAAGNALQFGAVESWSKRPSNSTGPGVNTIIEVTPDPRNEPVESVLVAFNKSIALSSFTYEDILLTRNGDPVALDATVTVSPHGDLVTIRVSGLTSFTAPDGVYELRVFGAGITDNDGDAGYGEAYDTWINGTPPGATLSGTLWHDVDLEGDIDLNEPRLSNWTVYLDANGNGRLDSGIEVETLTDSNGNYVFTDLSPGTYEVQELVKVGWNQTSPGGEGLLYFSEGANADGLYRLDTITGSATHLGKSNGLSTDVGLAATDDDALLLGSSGFDLIHINADGSDAFLIDDTPNSLGLTYDYDNSVWYGARSFSFYTLNPDTWQIDQLLPAPPQSIGGLAYGKGKIYALTTFELVFAYDIAASSWTQLSQAVNFVNPGGDFALAYDNFKNILYGKADNDPNLYRIDPVTGASSAIGNTGITRGGGLAFVGHHPVPHTVTVGFGDLVNGLNFGHDLAPDEVPPEVTLNVASPTFETSPIISAVVTDNVAVPENAILTIDVDLNNDSDFSDAGEADYSTAVLTDGTADIQIVPALAEGTYGVRGRVGDFAGNEGVSDNLPLIVDTTPPGVSIDSPHVTLDITPLISFSVSDNNSIPDSTTVYLDVDLDNDGDYDGPSELAYVSGSLLNESAEIELTPALSLGVYGLRVRVSDAAGLAGQSEEFTLHIVDELLTGDYDFSSVVDEADFFAWRSSFGSVVSPGSGADGNGNGIIDAADYTVWRDNLGATLPVASSITFMGNNQMPGESTIPAEANGTLPSIASVQATTPTVPNIDSRQAIDVALLDLFDHDSRFSTRPRPHAFPARLFSSFDREEILLVSRNSSYRTKHVEHNGTGVVNKGYVASCNEDMKLRIEEEPASELLANKLAVDWSSESSGSPTRPTS